MIVGRFLGLALYAGDNCTYIIYDEQTKRVLVGSILAPLKPMDKIDPSPYDSLPSRLPKFYWDAEHATQIITDNSDPYAKNERINDLTRSIQLYQNTELIIQDSAQGRKSDKTSSNIASTLGGIEVDTEQLGLPTRQVNVRKPTIHDDTSEQPASSRELRTDPRQYDSLKIHSPSKAIHSEQDRGGTRVSHPLMTDPSPGSNGNKVLNQSHILTNGDVDKGYGTGTAPDEHHTDVGLHQVEVRRLLSHNFLMIP